MNKCNSVKRNKVKFDYDIFLLGLKRLSSLFAIFYVLQYTPQPCDNQMNPSKILITYQDIRHFFILYVTNCLDLKDESKQKLNRKHPVLN